MPEKKKKGTTAFGGTSRRRFLTAVGAGVVLSALGAVPGRTSAETDVIRPPGAIGEKAFLSMCDRCGKCVPVCPSSVVRLQEFENGIQNFMTPKLVFDDGYCLMPSTGCQNCIDACPPRVLQHLNIEGLLSDRLSGVMKVGTAVLNKNLCIPYAQKEPCLECREICPVEGAITTKGHDVDKPVFNDDVCVGCGACEYVCPTIPKAVVVSSEGAKRTEWE